MSFKALAAGLKFDSKNNARVQALLNPTKPEEAPSTVSPVGTVDAESLRKRHKVKVTASSAIPDPIQSFSDILDASNDRILSNLLENGFLQPTPIQMQMIPLLGRFDALACSRTGSGKTLAFALPLLLRWNASQQDTLQSIVIEPTRELARQVYDQMKLISDGTGCRVVILGEESKPKQAHILIATPLKLINAIKSKALDIAEVDCLVLDEADRLFEDDFLTQTDAIFTALTNPSLKKAMFSATIPSGVEELARKVMSETDLVRVLVGCKEAASPLITQELKFCATEEGKLATFKQFFHDGTMRAPCLTFVQGVNRAKDLYAQLKTLQLDSTLKIDVVHSDLSKQARDEAMDSFRAGLTMVLVTTDALARGIDFKGVNLVINYDFPQSATSYVHRIGRTARYNRPGTAITLFTKDDAPHLRTIVNVMRSSGLQVPEWMLQIKAASKNAKRKLKTNPTKRLDIRDASGFHVENKKRKGTGSDSKAKQKRKKQKIDLDEA